MQSLKAKPKSLIVGLSLLGLVVFPTGCGAENSRQDPKALSVQGTGKQKAVQQPAKKTSGLTVNKGPVQKPAGAVTDPKLANAPKIPHAAKDNSKCLSCHKDGKKGAKITPHPERANCIECHKTK